ncbi:MAG: DUF3293 domain-containing protein [Kangiellaceae bacterium]|nr:DUF3293 domain-containing protein [Kangiellaceae bacterium]MCW8997090.1 DUF3293 domain-containing protein [Kangiellaceae bacterium]
MVNKLASAYREAIYQFSFQGLNYNLEVDRKNENLDRLLGSLDTSQAAFITAFNPQSQILSKTENTLNQSRLVKRVEQMGFQYLKGFSTDQNFSWPKEESLFVTGISFEKALALAVEFNQKGFLFIQLFRPVKLYFVSESKE